MRSVLIAAILAVLAVRASALDITTRAGTTYRHCEVTRVEPDGIVITSAEGVVRIPFEEMPEALQAQYHLTAEGVAAYRQQLTTVHTAAAQRAARDLQTRKILAANMEREKRGAAAPSPRDEQRNAPTNRAVSLSGLLFFFGALVVFLTLAFWVGRGMYRAWRWRRICAESDAFLQALEQGQEMPVAETNLPLLDDERACYCAPTALYETRAVRHYHAGNAGFRVARGAWVGDSESSPASRQEWTRIDAGILMVTNRRLVFEGQSATRAYALRRVMTVNSFADSVEVGVENREKRMVFDAANPLILASIIRISCEVLETAHQHFRESGPKRAKAEYTYGQTRHSAPPPSEEPPPEPKKKQRQQQRPPSPEVESEEAIHGRVLGLSGKITFADIKRQYRQRMLEYHPDKVAALGPKIRTLSEEETKKINAAYEFFSRKYASRGGI